MSPTPLCDALRAFAETAPLRLHMPGHHGRPMPLAELGNYATLDFTELAPTGDLFAPGGAIEAAEELWSTAFGMPRCLFLTGGSTQGIHAAMTLACTPGDGVLIDRGSHRAVYNAMALTDLHPTYLPRPWLSQGGITGPVSPQTVEKILSEHPNIKTVCITSPTYYGVLSDITAVAAVVHSHGGKLVVDGAHGAHLPFLGENPYTAADLVVVSAHKTLPAPGQTALLFAGAEFTMAALRRACALYGSSSPSYPMMAALDAVRAYMEETGAEAYRSVAAEVQLLRGRYPFETGDALLDPTRFVLPCDGFEVQAKLEAMGIYPEMADTGHVVFIFTCYDKGKDFTRLKTAIEAILGDGGDKPPVCAAPPPFPEQVYSPREALFSPRQSMVLARAEGQIAAEQIAPYPPGVPVVAPGERLDKKQLSYLQEIGYNMVDKIGIL